jgi:hypothetical protein
MATLPAEQPKQKHPIPALFERLGISGVTPKDRFNIEYSDNLFTVQVRRASGLVETARVLAKGDGFRQLSSFDPSQIPREQRDALIRTLSKDGMTQSRIAQHTGISQATVSNVLRKKD